MFGLEAERPRHAATAGLDQFEIEPWRQRQRLAQALHDPERLLVAMAMNMNLDAVGRLERQFQSALRLAGDEFLEQIKILAELADLLAEPQAEKFVAHRQQAGRLQPDDRRAGGDRRLQRRQHPFGLGPGFWNHAHREIGPSAAQGAAGFGIVRRRPRDLHAIAAGGEHGDRRLGNFRIEMLGERIDEQPDLAALALTERPLPDKRPRRRGWQGPARGQAQKLFRRPGDRRQGVARLDQRPRRAAPATEPGRQPAEQSGPRRNAMGLVALGEIFGLDQHHVDGARTFFLAGLAGDAQIHRRRQSRVAKRLVAIIAIERRLEGRDPRLGRMGGIMGDAIARAHHASALALAAAIVHAHRHRLGVIAATGRDARIGVANAISVVSRPIEVRFHTCSPCRTRGQARTSPDARSTRHKRTDARSSHPLRRSFSFFIATNQFRRLAGSFGLTAERRLK